MTTRLVQEAARQSQRMLRALGDEYRRSREDAGLSQRQVATAAGISQSHYSTIEAGTVVASVELHERIALALGGQLNVRFYPGTGPRLRGRFQAPTVEAFYPHPASSMAALPRGRRPAPGIWRDRPCPGGSSQAAPRGNRVSVSAATPGATDPLGANEGVGARGNLGGTTANGQPHSRATPRSSLDGCNSSSRKGIRSYLVRCVSRANSGRAGLAYRRGAVAGIRDRMDHDRQG